MIQATGHQQNYRATGRRYRILLAPEGWGKTYLLAYDALWYARFTNKRILVVTPRTDEFNQALSEYCILEHDTSEIVVSTDYIKGDWFMCIIDCAETYTEVQLKDLMREAADAKLLWVSSRLLPETHFLQQLMREKRSAKNTKTGRDWWCVVGEKNESYRENTRTMDTVEDTVEGQPY